MTPGISLSLCLVPSPTPVLLSLYLWIWVFFFLLLQASIVAIRMPDSGPLELPALGPRPPHFLNPLQSVSWPESRMQGKQEGGGPRGSGPQASLLFLPQGRERWVSRKHSTRNERQTGTLGRRGPGEEVADPRADEPVPASEAGSEGRALGLPLCTTGPLAF